MMNNFPAEKRTFI